MKKKMLISQSDFVFHVSRKSCKASDSAIIADTACGKLSKKSVSLPDRRISESAGAAQYEITLHLRRSSRKRNGGARILVERARRQSNRSVLHGWPLVSSRSISTTSSIKTRRQRGAVIVAGNSLIETISRRGLLTTAFAGGALYILSARPGPGCGSP